MLFKPVKRLTKRQIKEDKLVTMAAKTSAWLRLNYPMIIAGGGRACSTRHRRETLSWVKMKHLAWKPQVLLPKPRSPRSKSGLEIYFYTGKRHILNIPAPRGEPRRFYLWPTRTSTLAVCPRGRGRFKGASTTTRTIRFMVYAGWIGLAACLEQEGKPGEAAAKYEGFANTFRDSPFRGASLIDAARCYGEAGNRDKKRALLEMFIEGHKDSPLVSDARVRLKTM